MNMLPFEFKWPISSEGYVWATATEVNTDVAEDQSQPGLFLIDRADPGTKPLTKYYEPLRDESGLFMIFAGLDEKDPEKIRDFASRYGTLGMATDIVVGDRSAKGEGLSIWQVEIERLKRWVDLWCRIKSRDENTLALLIRSEGPSRVWLPEDLGIDLAVSCGAAALLNDPRVHLADGVKFIASELLPRELLSEIACGQHLSAAEYLLAYVVERQLLLPGVSFGFSTKPIRLRWRVHRLVDALWLQFALAIDGNKGYRACPECTKWFEVGNHAARSDKRFCSDSCRASAHRKKPNRSESR